LRVISVADPASPAEVGYCDTPGEAEGVAVSGSYAYVADGSAGLRIISVTDPAHPVEVGHCGAPADAYGVAVSGSDAYLADGSAGLRVISVSNPAYPGEVGYYDTTGVAHGVAVSGSYAYVANGSAGLQIYDYYGTGVQETMNDERATRDLPQTVMRRLPQGAVVFDAMGRRVVNPRLGIFFGREAVGGQPSAVAVRKVVVQR
jgi:hypothetical protein